MILQIHENLTPGKQTIFSAFSRPHTWSLVSLRLMAAHSQALCNPLPESCQGLKTKPVAHAASATELPLCQFILLCKIVVGHA